MGGVFLVVVLLVTLQDRRDSRQLKDAVQVRGIQQSFVVWCSSNASEYPFPSRIDAMNSTIADPDEAKNTTANFLSIIIQNGHVTPELLINPAEANTAQVVAMSKYVYQNPPAAAVPENALWDPAFRGTPEDPDRVRGAAVAGNRQTKPGNQSYAQLIPTGRRVKQWADTYNSTEACFGDRGPTYATNDFAPQPVGGAWSLVPGALGTGSHTLSFFGGGKLWKGNIAFNDNHVDFLTSPVPSQTFYKRGTPKKDTPDNLFVNESDETNADLGPGSFGRGMNAYLRPIAEMGPNGTARVWRD